VNATSIINRIDEPDEANDFENDFIHYYEIGSNIENLEGL